MGQTQIVNPSTAARAARPEASETGTDRIPVGPGFFRGLIDGMRCGTQGEGIKYDEWDYRRGDYKKAWCSLFETDIRPGQEPFLI